MNRRILDESKNYKLVNEWEKPILIDKRNKHEYFLREHYGDPSCGIISEMKKYCIVGGEGLSIYHFEKNEEFNFLSKLPIHSIKMNDENSIKILVDPWSDDHGTWILNINDFTINKISEKPDMREMPYQEIVEY
jgi:hypothetical protein